MLLLYTKRGFTMNVLEYIGQAKSVLGNYIPPAIRYLNIGTFVEDIRVKTMSIDNTQIGKLYIRVNPKWVMRLKVQELSRILCDVATKICLHHCTTRKTFNNYGLIASDIICNRFVSVAGIITNIDFSDVFDRTRLNELKEKAQKKYYELNEEVYKEDEFVMEKLAYYISLIDNENPQGGNKNESNCGDSNDSNDEGNGGNNSSQGSNDSNEDSYGEENCNQNCKQNGNSNSKSNQRNNEKDESRGQNSSGETDSNTSAVEEYFNDMSRDEMWNENQYTKDMTEMETDSMERNGILASTRWGIANGNIFQNIIKANKPPVDPMLFLKQFMGNKKTSNRVTTWAKPNRRFGIGFKGSKKLRKQHFLICGDASGSMGDKELSEVMDLILATGKHKCMVDYAWWDTICDKPTKLKSSKVSRDGIDVTKGGGTNPKCIFNMLKENHLNKKYTGIIIVSDMYFEMTKPKDFDMNKVFWIGTNNSGNPPEFVKSNRFLSADKIQKAIKNRKK